MIAMMRKSVKKHCYQTIGMVGRKRLVGSLLLSTVLTAWLAGWLASPVLAASPTGCSIAVHVPPPDPDLPDPSGRRTPTALSSAEAGRLLLPDLRMLPPSDLEIETFPDGLRELRLSNTIWNSGVGPLELEGEINPVTRKTSVQQHIQVRVGARRNHLVGEFV
jgi:hypothetical protein